MPSVFSPTISSGSASLFSNPSSNKTLAWSKGGRGEGPFRITFPLPSSWYDEQPCTAFKSLEHWKERTLLGHEYIVLVLNNGARCRLERMGDADARFNALSTHGSAAHDFAQCFQPEHFSQVHLHPSDLIARVTFPDILDLKDVLRVCRAIHEDDKAYNYQLQSFNCYFFCLAIQSTLSRLVAPWGDTLPYDLWKSTIRRAVDHFSDADWAQWHAENEQSIFLRIFSLLKPHAKRPTRVLTRRMQSVLCEATLHTQMNAVLDSTLWHSELGPAVDYVLEGAFNDAIKLALKDSLTITPNQFPPVVPPLHITDPPEHPNSPPNPKYLALTMRLGQFRDALIALMSLAASRHESRPQTPRQMRSKKYVTHISQPNLCSKSIEMNFQPQRSSITADNNGLQPLVEGALGLFLWALNVFFCFVSALGLWQYFFRPLSRRPSVDEQLASLLDQTGNPSLGDSVGLAAALGQVDALLRDGRTALPWTCVQDMIKGYVLSRLCAQETAVLKVIFGDEDVPQTTNVSTFQGHLRNRIDVQAKLVERHWLGSAGHISKQLHEKLTQVWVMLRDDVDEFELPTNSPLKYISALLGSIATSCFRTTPQQTNVGVNSEEQGSPISNWTYLESIKASPDRPNPIPGIFNCYRTFGHTMHMVSGLPPHVVHIGLASSRLG